MGYTGIMEKQMETASCKEGIYISAYLSHDVKSVAIV